ncbi:NAD(P)H-dependent oxidoreductase [Cupriavidus sp. BIS7]|uniref:NADPH-dependent FMN reductase n=1 Tax=Cupriavidus sp. BIS7 TaxID=1217718 RepID=UPI0002E6AE67|nr:NAD(P)H-dependent oxidoreductase [Cupriavidus sp. BIS7]
MPATKLLALSGSQRSGSFNQRLLDRAAALARDAGAEVTKIHLSDFPLPLYTPQVEAAGFPDVAREFKALFRSHHGFLIASPEYNGSVTAALKNAIDWVSRPTDGEAQTTFSAFRGKIAGVMSASPSAFGGLRGLQHLRQILGTVQTLVVTEQVALPFADKAFDGDALLDGAAAQLLPALVQRVVQLARLTA